MIGPLTVPLLEGIPHGFFSRHGGVGTAPFDSLDVGFDPAHKEEDVVAENRRRVLAAFPGMHTLVAMKQVHGKAVVQVTEGAGSADGRPDPDAPEADALISNVPGALLLVQTADCQPVLLWDPEKKAVGAAHSGWRGSVRNIIAESVLAMEAAYGCRPQDLRAAIGPCLGPCCAEFVNWKRELPEEFRGYAVSATHFDFLAISRKQLVDSGVKPEHVASLGACTRCGDDWFSYRREGLTGRLASVIGIPED